MSVKEFKEHAADSCLWGDVAECMDRDRRAKLDRLKNPGKRAACAGAGLLLQWAYYQYFQCMDAGSIGTDGGAELITVSHDEIMKKIKSPFDFEICREKNGKPYIKNHPFFYNISHSGDYVFCAVSDSEIGADIQKKSKTDYNKLAERFFSEEEAAAVNGLEDICQKNELFYRLWCRKEALGKLSGEGIASSVGSSLLDTGTGMAGGYIWEEYEILTDYQIAVCRYHK
jgi:4'-phosphopantetheinyl transferase